MPQTVVNDDTQAFFEGLCANKRFAGSYIANSEIAVGKAVGIDPADLDQFGDPLSTGGQTCAPLNAATESLLVGVSMYDAQREVPAGATYASFAAEQVVPVLRVGRIWVFVAAAVTDLSDAVYARTATAGASPDAALGTFRPGTAADHTLVSNARFIAAGAIGARNFALLEINL